MRRLVYYALALAGLAALGWWAYGWHRPPAVDPNAAQAAAGGPATGPAGVAPGKGQDGAKGGEAGKGGGPRGPTSVEAALVREMPLRDEATAVGALRANETVMLKPEIAGRIAAVHFRDGERVARGALLVALDASVPRAEAEQARAELGLARANYQRTADLAQKNFVSERARDEAAATMQVLEAKLKLAEARLARYEIRAPFAGVLGLRNVSVGDYVKEGADLVVLDDFSSVLVDVRLPERLLGQLRRGQRIRLSVDTYPEKDFAAVLEATEAQVDANGRFVIARGRVSNPQGLLRGGMFVRARLVLAERAKALVIPEEALVPAGDEQFVYRIEAGKALRTKVATGIRRDGLVEIVQGLAAGNQVVTAGQMRLQRDGTEVKVIDPPASGAGAATGVK